MFLAAFLFSLEGKGVGGMNRRFFYRFRSVVDVCCWMICEIGNCIGSEGVRSLLDLLREKTIMSDLNVRCEFHLF